MRLAHTIGSANWWLSVSQQGTPVIGKGEAGRHPVTFLWQDPQGDESSSPVRRVWINITGISDHHRCARPHSLARIPGTNVWQATFSLSERWRGSYSLMPDTLTAMPDEGASMLVLRNWWQSKFPLAQSDNLNPRPGWINGRGHQVSPLHMPKAPPQRYWEDDGQRSPSRLRFFNWQSSLLGNRRVVGILTTGQRNPANRPLIIFLDGQFWAKTMPLEPPLTRMTEAGEIPEAVYLFIDSIDTLLRSQELPCNTRFWLAVQQELLPQIQQTEPFSNLPEKTIVAGQSFGGLSALYAALNWPERFGCVLSQSGSFWWPERTAPSSRQQGKIAELVSAGLGQGHGLRLALDAGRHEDIIMKAHRQLIPLLERAGHLLLFREIEGGHDALCWRSGITDGLHWLLSGSAPTK